MHHGGLKGLISRSDGLFPNWTLVSYSQGKLGVFLTKPKVNSLPNSFFTIV